MQNELKIAIVFGIVDIIISPIVVKLWDQITPIFLNILFSQNIPINQYQAFLGIILFGVVIVSGVFFVYYINKFSKKKQIEIPPEGIKYAQIACPYCNHPNIVYPPTNEYKGVVFSKCKEKGLEVDHNVKSESKCPNCHKKFEFYWCAGHTYFFSVGKRRNFRPK